VEQRTGANVMKRIAAPDDRRAGHLVLCSSSSYTGDLRDLESARAAATGALPTARVSRRSGRTRLRSIENAR